LAARERKDKLGRAGQPSSAFELTLKTATAIVFIAMCPVRRFLAFESSALF
jgi:hypothetical protein